MGLKKLEIKNMFVVQLVFKGDKQEIGSRTQVQQKPPEQSSSVTAPDIADAAEPAADRHSDPLETLYMTTGMYAEIMELVVCTTKILLSWLLFN